MDLKIRNEISRTNSFTFSNISSLNGNQSPVDQQMSKLVKFVQGQRNTLVRKELETLLPPLVCHLFIEMLKGKEWRPAHEFLRKYSPLVGHIQEIQQQKLNGTDSSVITPQPIQFSQDHVASNHNQNSFQRLPSTSKNQPPQISQLKIDEPRLCMFRELITTLSCIRRIEDGKDNKLIINFRSCKYKAQMAEKTLEILNKYLAKHGHVLIIQILHVWFSMDIYELHDESNNDSSSSLSDYAILNHLDHSADLVRQNHKGDRYSDPAHCDNPKDIKFSVKSKFHHSDYDASMTPNVQGPNEGTEEGMLDSNMKLKRLRECLHRVDNKYHKPIRIFNINYTENR
jgi:transcription initiation factor TFIID subunit 5